MPDGEWVICARHAQEAGRRFLDELTLAARRGTAETGDDDE
jgi:hypothetical protein